MCLVPSHRMEAGQGGEAISDIHNYLDTFNKEIQTGDQGPTSECLHAGLLFHHCYNFYLYFPYNCYSLFISTTL